MLKEEKFKLKIDIFENKTMYYIPYRLFKKISRKRIEFFYLWTIKYYEFMSLCGKFVFYFSKK
jgi:hypothetical protein